MVSFESLLKSKDDGSNEYANICCKTERPTAVEHCTAGGLGNAAFRRAEGWQITENLSQR